MAKPRKRYGGWYARVKDASGRWAEVLLPARNATEAKAQSAELTANARAAALGLKRAGLPPTMKEVYATYEKTAKREASWASKESRFRLHILPRFGEKRLHTITPADVEELMADVQDPPLRLSPQSADHIRVSIAAIYTFAIKRARLYEGENPGRLARKADIPQRPPRFLELADLVAVLEQVSPRWRNLFGVCALTGIRLGEAKALRVSDVDLKRRLLFVWKSNARNTTKQKRINVVPINSDAMPFMMGALKEAKSEFVFSDDKGRQLKASKSFVSMLRQALIKAGLVVGYDLECVVRKPASGGAHGRSKLTEVQVARVRSMAGAGIKWTVIAREFGVTPRAVRKVVDGESWTKSAPLGCGYTERRAQADRAPCPKCGRLMWARPVPVPFVFHNLRSTAATHHLEATGDVRFVQGLLGHADAKTTERYAHLRPERMVAQADRLSLPQRAPKNEVDLDGIGGNVVDGETVKEECH